jgi:hypothetical protein
MEQTSTGNGISGVIHRNHRDGTVRIQGRITALGSVAQTIQWIAAAPVTRGISYAGSGMPYPNKDIAFSKTPNAGTVQSVDGSFDIQLIDIPAGYYVGLGSVYVPPTVEFTSRTPDGKQFQTVLWINDTAAPFRWVAGSPATMRPEMNTETHTGRAMYYSGRETLPLFQNQEAILRTRGYPGDMAARGIPEADDSQPWSRVVAPA